jgi:sodium-independent sulfate anion transporter 11
MASIVRWSKRVVGYSDEAVPVISAKEWIQSLSEDPKRDVGSFCHGLVSAKASCWQIIDYFVGLFPILGWISRYSAFYIFMIYRRF